MATSSSALIAAARDNDILARVIALSAELGVDNPQAWAESNRHQLAAAPVSADGDTVASVYEYAAAQPRFRAGEDPAAVTDEHLRSAIQVLINEA